MLSVESLVVSAVDLVRVGFGRSGNEPLRYPIKIKDIKIFCRHNSTHTRDVHSKKKKIMTNTCINRRLNDDG